MHSWGSWRTAVLLAGLAFLHSPERAVAASFECRAVNLSVNTVPAVQTTTSTTPVNLPGSNVTVEMDGCVRVQFSAQVRAKAPARLRVRLTIDGVPAGIPAFADFQTSGDGYDNRVVTFVIRNAGSTFRTLRLQYSSVDGRAVRVTKGVVTVWYTEPAH